MMYQLTIKHIKRHKAQCKAVKESKMKRRCAWTQEHRHEETRQWESVKFLLKTIKLEVLRTNGFYYRVFGRLEVDLTSKHKNTMNYKLSLPPSTFGWCQLSLATSSAAEELLKSSFYGAVKRESFSNCQGRQFTLWIGIIFFWLFIKKFFLSKE